MRKVFRLVWLQIKYDWMVDTAYLSKNITMVFSTFFFSLFYLYFVDVLFSKVKLLAGYNKDEALLLFFMYQLSFYASWIVKTPSARKFPVMITSGGFDFVLLRPVSALVQMVFLKFQILSTLIWGLLPLILVFYKINWQSLELNKLSLFLGFYILVVGWIIFECFGFIISCTVFFNPDLKKIHKLHDSFWEVSNTPWEGYSHPISMTLATILPVAFISVIPASVALGKSDAGLYAVLASLVCGTFLLLRYYIWQISVKHYVSLGG